MNKKQAVENMREVLRRKHLALSTEESYVGWLQKFIKELAGWEYCPPTPAGKMERWLSALANRGVVTPHNFRHAYATHLLDRGVNIKALAEAMGHSNIETTSGYVHTSALSVPSPL